MRSTNEVPFGFDDLPVAEAVLFACDLTALASMVQPVAVLKTHTRCASAKLLASLLVALSVPVLDEVAVPVLVVSTDVVFRVWLLLPPVAGIWTKPTRTGARLGSVCTSRIAAEPLTRCRVGPRRPWSAESRRARPPGRR